MFQIMTPENSATVTMNNNITGHSETVVTGSDTRSIAYAVFCFAKRQGIAARHVGHSVKTPSSDATAALPDWAPQVGSTVHIHTNGKRKSVIPHTIESYSLGSNGTWIFKAVDFAGWSHIDTVDTLRAA